MNADDVDITILLLGILMYILRCIVVATDAQTKTGADDIERREDLRLDYCCGTLSLRSSAIL
jgi:hypothetical protein